MLNPKFFQKLKEEYDFYNQERRLIIGQSAEALHKAKQAIFSLHRDEIKEAGKLLDEVEAVFKGFAPKIKKDESLRYEGAYRAAQEEYVEAKEFFKFLHGDKVDFIKEGDTSTYRLLDTEIYLGGICDMTGELLRKAVTRAGERKFEEVVKYKKGIEDIMAELIKFNLTGYLRTKYDQAKRNLREIEKVLYEVNLRS